MKQHYLVRLLKCVIAITYALQTPSSGSNSLFSFGYKLPSNSYAIFRIPSKSFSSEGGQQNEFIREKRNLLVNSNRMGRQLTTSEKSKTTKHYHHENQNCA